MKRTELAFRSLPCCWSPLLRDSIPVRSVAFRSALLGFPSASRGLSTTALVQNETFSLFDGQGGIIDWAFYDKWEKKEAHRAAKVEPKSEKEKEKERFKARLQELLQEQLPSSTKENILARYGPEEGKIVIKRYDQIIIKHHIAKNFNKINFKNQRPFGCESAWPVATQEEAIS